MAGTRVLIVDDEREFAETLAQRMEVRGLLVETAANGAEAIAKVEGGEYDAVVLDMVMPGMDGIETLKKIKGKKPDFQVILLTGHASVEKGIESMKVGAMDFVEKPAELETLLAKIEEAKARRLVLVDRQREQELKDILLKRGW